MNLSDLAINCSSPSSSFKTNSDSLEPRCVIPFYFPNVVPSRHDLTCDAIASIFALCLSSPEMYSVCTLLLLKTCEDKAELCTAWTLSTLFLLLWYSANDFCETDLHFSILTSLTSHIPTKGLLGASPGPLSTMKTKCSFK